MRHYEPIWIQLKTCDTRTVTVSAPSPYHKRIYKALIKEKNRDNLFHLLLDGEGKVSKLSKRSEGNALVVTLHISYTLDGII